MRAGQRALDWKFRAESRVHMGVGLELTQRVTRLTVSFSSTHTQPGHYHTCMWRGGGLGLEITWVRMCAGGGLSELLGASYAPEFTPGFTRG